MIIRPLGIVHFLSLRLTASTSVFSRTHHNNLFFKSNQIRSSSNINMAEVKQFPPQKLRAIVAEVATLLKEKGESVSVVETVRSQLFPFRFPFHLSPKLDLLYIHDFSFSSSRLASFEVTLLILELCCFIGSRRFDLSFITQYARCEWVL